MGRGASATEDAKDGPEVIVQMPYAHRRKVAFRFQEETPLNSDLGGSSFFLLQGGHLKRGNRKARLS